MLGKQYYGTKTGTTQAVTVPTSGVTEHFNAGGANLAETWNGAPTADAGTGNVTLTWSSVEGGTYKLEATTDLSTTPVVWTTLNASVPAPANTVVPQPATIINKTSITDPAATSGSPKKFYRVSRNP